MGTKLKGVRKDEIQRRIIIIRNRPRAQVYLSFISTLFRILAIVVTKCRPTFWHIKSIPKILHEIKAQYLAKNQG